MSAGRRRVAFIAGSGMDPVAGAVTIQREIPFDAIAGVGAAAVAGHRGRVLEGTVGGRECTLVMGRRHVYEGDPRAVSRLIEWLAARGVTDLVVASAAGALDRRLAPGDLVVARDLVDLQNRNLIARRGEDAGPAGAPQRLRIDAALAGSIEDAATRAGVPWQRGTIVCGAGPAYETPAEVRALQAWGDVATMSSAPELAAAAKTGLRAAAIALVTNPCTGVADSRPRHGEVLEAGRRAAGGLASVIRELVMK